MIRASLFAAVLAVAACSPPDSPRLLNRPELKEDRDLTVPRPERFRLDNGLRVVVAADRASNLVGVDVRYAVGAVEDPPGKSGLAHVTEHMMFELGPHAPLLKDRLASTALSYNAYTSFDETHYMSLAMADQLEPLLALEAERMTARCEQMSEVVFARELDVVRSELRQRDTVAARVATSVRAAVYGPDHPYSRTVGGHDSDLDAMTLADVCRFVDTYYAPERAVLVVTGNVDAVAARPAIEAAFGSVLPRPTPRRPHVSKPALVRATSRHDLPVERASALIATPAPVSVDREGALSATLANLFEDMLYADMIALDYVTSFEISRVGGARAPLHVASITVDDPARVKDAAKAFFRAREKLPGLLDATNVPRQIQRTAARTVRGYESLSARGDILADYAQYGEDSLHLGRQLVWLRAATVGQLARRAERYFAVDRSHVAYVYPDKTAAVSDDAALSRGGTQYDVEQWNMPVAPGEHTRDLPVAASALSLSVRSIRLDNGMRVLLAPKLEYPSVDIRLVFPVGTLHDPVDKPGVADLTASFLLPDDQVVYWIDDYTFLNEVRAMGGEHAVWVTERSTTFRMRGLSIYTEGLLWQLGWMLERGEVSAKALVRYRELLAEANEEDEERRTRQRGLAMRAALYGAQHPYATDTSAADVAKRISAKELRAFRRNHYQPDKAVLVVAGNFDPDDIEARIRAQFGAWRGRSKPAQAQTIPPAASRRATEHFGHVDDDTSQVTIAFAYATAPGHKHDVARAVLEEMLQARMSGLREQLASTYGIKVSQSQSVGPGLLFIGGAIDAGAGGQALEAMLLAMAALRDGEDAPAAFARARRQVLRRALAQSFASATVATHLVASAEGRRRLRGQLDEARAIARLRLPAVQALIDTELRATDGIVFVSGRRQAIERTYAAAGIRDVTYLD